MRSSTLRMTAAAAAGALAVAMTAPAAAAQEPDGRSSCLAEVFQAQAVEAPRTVSDRILEIRELYLGGSPFGQALKPLALGAEEYCP